MGNSNMSAACSDNTDCDSLCSKQNNRKRVCKSEKKKSTITSYKKVSAFSKLESHKLIQSILDTYGGINISEVSKNLKTTYTNLWYCFNAQRKWNADVWLKTLMCLNMVDVEDDRIIIYTKPSDKLMRTHKKLSSAECFYCEE